MAVNRVTAADARELTGSVYLTREQAAKILGIEARTLRGNKYTGPPWHKFFSRVMYELSDVEEWAKREKAERRQGWFPTVDRTYRDK